MKYIELTVKTKVAGLAEVLLAELADLGFESFAEFPEGFQAYVKDSDFPENEVNSMAQKHKEHCSFNIAMIQEKNWNEEWEKNFQAVTIGELCHIRAPFHPKMPCKYEIIIEPKMSFGTGHHETTSMMVTMMNDIAVEGKSLLDMGCGTALLAILASKMGAKRVVAIDNDEWAYRNSLENIAANGTNSIEVSLGDAQSLSNFVSSSFDIILANINRNILLRDMEFYAAVLKEKGLILFSGFYEADRPLLVEKAKQFFLEEQRFITLNHWMALLMIKNV